MARQSQPLVLALDIGSSSVRSALFDLRGRRRIESTASRQYTIRYTADGAAELDIGDLVKATRSCFAKTRRAAKDVPLLSIAGSAFWHGLLGIDARGRAVTPVLMWADSRSAPDAAELRREFSERRTQLRTGCMLRAPYWPAKLRWFKRTAPNRFRRVARWLSPAARIFEEMFGVGWTSHSMASGTGFYNLRGRHWDDELCRACDVSPEQLGALVDSGSSERNPTDVQVFTAIGDGLASNLGSGADGAGKIAINVGTSAAVRMVLPRENFRAQHLPHGLFAYAVDEHRIVVGGAVSNAGNLRAWCVRELQLADEPPLDRRQAADNPLSVVPIWVQERAPDWPEDRRGLIDGISQTTTAADIDAATTRSVFDRLALILELLENAYGVADEVIVSGGILRSPESRTVLSDCLGRPIRVCAEMESSLRGAAIYALQHNGINAPPLPRGRIVRHQPALAEKHRARRDLAIRTRAAR